MSKEHQLKALGHETRLRIYQAVSREPLCVCELTELLELSQPSVSQHLTKLRNADLIESERRGQWTFYRAADSASLESLNEFVGPLSEQLLEKLNEITKEQRCKIRDNQGNLPENLS